MTRQSEAEFNRMRSVLSTAAKRVERSGQGGQGGAPPAGPGAQRSDRGLDGGDAAKSVGRPKTPGSSAGQSRLVLGMNHGWKGMYLMISLVS